MVSTKKIIQKVLSYALIVAMVFSTLGGYQTKSYADTGLADGEYTALIRPAIWDSNEPIRYSIDISDRVKISVHEGKADIRFQVNGYSKYEAIYMVKQAKNAEIQYLAPDNDDFDDDVFGKIGDDWTNFDGEALVKYNDEKLAKYKDSEMNDCFEKLEKPQAQDIDESKDTAIFCIKDVDLNKKIGLVGYAGNFLSKDATLTNPLAYIKNVSFQVDAMDIKPCDADEVFSNDTTELYPIFTSYAHTDLEFLTDSTFIGDRKLYCKTDFRDMFSSIVCDKSAIGENPSIIKLKLKVKDDYKGEIAVANKLKARLAEETLTGKGDRTGYLAGNAGIEWSDNFYDGDSGEIVIPLTKDEYIYGVRFKIIEKDFVDKFGKNQTPLHYGNLEFTKDDLSKLLQIKDDATGIIFESDSLNLTGNETLEITPVTLEYIDSLTYQDPPQTMEEFIKKGIKDNAQIVYEQFSKTAIDGKFQILLVNIKRNGEYFVPKHWGKLFVPIPEDWEMSKFNALLQGLHVTTSYPDSVFTVEKIGEKTYLGIRDEGLKSPNSSILSKENHANIAMGVLDSRVNVAELEEGIYEVRPDFLRAGSENTGSMAGGTLLPKAYLVVNADKSKEVYLNFKGMGMGGMTAYMATLWNKTDKDVTHFDWITNEMGALISNVDFDPNTEFACLKSAKIKLSDDRYDEETFKYHFKVIPPAMGAGLPFEDVYNDPIDADLVFYGAKKLDIDINDIPTYQKSVLRRSIDKAKTLKAKDYTADTFAKIAPVLKEGEDYYKTLDGKDAGKDKTISNEIAAKSDAIEKAIKGLKSLKDPTKPDPTKPTQEDSKLDIKTLSDGSYTISGSMVKENKKSRSMADGAINREVGLRVKNGKYEITLDFQGLHYLGRFGFLKELKYFENDYITNSYGTPTGSLKEARINNYQLDKDGKRLKDEYGTDYPNEVTFPLIDKAKDEGFVPLQVFVPVMEAIGKEDGRNGLGTQPVYLKLNLKSIRNGAPSGSDGGKNSGSSVVADPKEDQKLTPEEAKKQEVKADEVLLKEKIVDVSKHWAKKSIAYVVEKNLFKGASTTVDKNGNKVNNFEPESNMTRSMVATVLYRLAGTPAVTTGTGMVDVKAGSWYANAVNWAISQKITSGVGQNSFAPDKPITREAFVTMIYSYAKANDPKMNKKAELGKYKDMGNISTWSKEALEWAAGMGFISGNDKGELNPQKTITRAEVATIFERYLKESEAEKAKAEKAKADAAKAGKK